MIQDAIRMLAAAMCGETKKIKVDVTPDPALRPIMEFILLISAYVQISVSGVAEVDPITHLPQNNLPLRFSGLNKDVFLLLAGVVTKLNLIFRAENVEGGMESAELQTLSDAMDGILVFSKSGESIILSSFSTYDSVNPDVAVSPVFAAGVVIGAALGFRSTRFRLGANRNAPEVLCALSAINEFGGIVTENEDGTVTVKTLRGRFHPKTGKRLKKKANK